MKRLRRLADEVGVAQLILVAFVLVLFAAAWTREIPVAGLASDSLTRFGRNGFLVLALVPMVRGGLGLNFGLPLGILCGLFGMLVSMEIAPSSVLAASATRLPWKETGLDGLVDLSVAALVAAPLAAVVGILYGVLLNRVRGQEMMVGTYVGFSAVALMCIFWLVVPFRNPKMIWALGGRGLRTTLDMPAQAKRLLDRSLALHLARFHPLPDAKTAGAPRRVLLLELVPFRRHTCLVVSSAGAAFKRLPDSEDTMTRVSGAEAGDEEGVGWILTLPTGLVGAVLAGCWLVASFFRTRLGLAIHCAGSNPLFARSSGIDVDRARIWASTLSTVLAALGIILYVQSFCLVQLYTAPLMMAFPAVAALLIGGATAYRATMGQVIVGALLFNTLLTIALPVINSLIEGDLSEVVQSVVSNGMILYALTREPERQP
jgi:simple sugar transport system permease protein